MEMLPMMQNRMAAKDVNIRMNFIGE
jgi:hypothetical protein